jgi:hypothetical protein
MINIPNWFIKFFKFFFKGGKIDVTLIRSGGSGRRPMREYPKPGVVGKGYGVVIYDESDLIRDWEITNNFRLVLSNNSTYDAYDVTFSNIMECFDATTHIQQPLNIKAGNQYEIVVTFNQYMTAQRGQETDILPPIPERREGSILKIKYKNEAGTFLTTNFFISSTNPRNVYGYEE